MNRCLVSALLLVGCIALSQGATVASGPGRKLNIPAFNNAGKTVGLEVWRVENFQPVAIPKAEHGKFYTGDSYIVMNTVEDKKKVKSHDIHFWLGTKTTQDEAGSAAILSVQLDDLLGGVPVQHREVEGSESDQFLGYFKGGVRYLEGGVASGFKHVTTNDPGAKRLFHIKGTKNIRVRQVELAVSAMNKGDCFILDAGREIYVYVGPHAGRVEKLKAINFANEVRDQDHAGRSKVHIVDEFSTLTDQENFFTVLGSGSPTLVPDQSTAPADAAFEKSDAARVQLYRVTDAKGKLAVEPITERPLKQEFLKQEDSFILDTGSGLYVWIGKGATQQEKTQALAKAQEFIGSKKYPAWTPVERLVQNGETAPFKHFFQTWRNPGSNQSRLNFEPVPVAVQEYGKFYTGDSYIVLNTKESKSGVLSWDVHFWLGQETSQDEAGSAAILTVQLDDRHNGAPVQHREVQDHEGSLFLSYFAGGVRYAAGGVKSGFNEVETNAAGEKRLFQVKGAKSVRVRQVPLAIGSMNKGDCFILDAGHEIYVYVGAGAKRVEKIKAISAAGQIRDQDHAGRANVHILDEFASSSEQQEFFDVLGEGSPDAVAEESECDETYERSDCQAITLYHVSDASGSLEITPIGERPLKQSMLDSDQDCYILDTGAGSIYVWIGKGATSQERSQAMVKAQEFITAKGYPVHTAVHRVVENGETTDFKQFFASWRDQGVNHAQLIKTAMGNGDESDAEAEFDPEVLHTFKKNGGRALGFMPDNGQGAVEIWRVQNYDLVPVEPAAYGTFYSGDSYLVRYEYTVKAGGHGYIVYFWQGKTSSTHEKGASAMHAVRMDDELAGKAILVRVAQGNEPRHFMKLFKGRMVTLLGDHDKQAADDTKLFRIRGTCADDVRAEELEPKAASLASDDVFLVKTPAAVYVWHGVGASDLEKEMAADIAAVVAPDAGAEVVAEEAEPGEFWDALGGQAEYDRELDPPGAPFLSARLFHCRILYNKKLRVEEVPHFEQDDLNVDDVMVLDGGDEVYCWIGNGATEEERSKSIDMARQYIRTDPSERTEETVPIVVLKQGAEPRSFKRLFPTWDDAFWEVSR
uniref:Gelsolin-like domain-containing protein n=1 Tax=Anopheles dirus TaxID=7168 RepID=A0A182N393_9DIPT